MTLPKEDKKPIGVRAQRQEQRRQEVLNLAASLFRKRGLQNVTMQQIADEMGVSKIVLYRRYPSKDALIEALFEKVVETIIATDVGAWKGYGSRIRATLQAVRSVEDGYVALVRDSALYSPSLESGKRLRNHSAGVIKRTLHFPEPDECKDPVAANLALESIVTFSHQTLAWWVQFGDAERDEEYSSYFAYMMRAWREGNLALFGLGDPNFEVPSGPVWLPKED